METRGTPEARWPGSEVWWAASPLEAGGRQASGSMAVPTLKQEAPKMQATRGGSQFAPGRFRRQDASPCRKAQVRGST